MRTPTYTRLNVDEIAQISDVVPAAYAASISALLIEDDRAGVTVPPDWFEAADKVIIGGRTLKDRHAPIDPTQRRATGALG